MARGRGRPRPPLAGSPQAALLSRLARQLHTTLVVGVTEPARPPPSATRSWPGAQAAASSACSRRCTGCPSASTCRSARSSRTFADLSGVPLDAGPGPRHRPACARRPGRSGSWSPSRSSTPAAATQSVRAGARAPGGAHQHVVLQHVAGAGAGGGGRHRAERRDRARPRAGRADRVQHGGRPSGASCSRAARSGGARCSSPPSPCAAASRRTTTGAISRSSSLAALGPPRRLGAGSCATRSSRSGCRRRARRRPRTWRGSTDRPRRRGAGRSRAPAGPRRPTA